MNKCDHIIGATHGQFPLIEKSRLNNEYDDYKEEWLDYIFIYCPYCGFKL